jgi:uncharacterized RDD family membrane protein YckC
MPMDTQPNQPQQQRYAPPTAEVADVSSDGAAVLAGRGARLGAVIIDTLILLGLWWVVSWVTPWNIFSPALMAQAGLATMLGLGLAGIVLYVAVNGWLLAQRGQTVGKLLLGLRMTRRDGSTAGFARLAGLRFGVGALVTNVPVVGMLYALVDVLFIFRADRRCLHDMIADTIVVKA